MSGYNEYFNLGKIPDDFSDKLKKISDKFVKKFEHWNVSIEFVNEWPLNNCVRLNYGDLKETEIAEIEKDIVSLFDKFKLKFEFATTTGICYEE